MTEENAKLLPSEEMEVEEMTPIRCEECGRTGEMRLSPHASGAKGFLLAGIVTCLEDGHQWPIKIRNDVVVETKEMMPVHESDSLIAEVPEGLIQDVEEAERAHFGQCYKASVVMCRRALQLALVEKGISDKPFSIMLREAEQCGILTGRNVGLAETIKDLGDAGAHRREEITAQDANLMIYASVRLLNEMFAPASQSERDSNEP